MPHWLRRTLQHGLHNLSIFTTVTIYLTMGRYSIRIYLRWNCFLCTFTPKRHLFRRERSLCFLFLHFLFLISFYDQGPTFRALLPGEDILTFMYSKSQWRYRDRQGRRMK